MQRIPSLRTMIFSPRYSSSAMLLRLLRFARHRSNRGFRDDAAFAVGKSLASGFFPFAFHRALCPMLPIGVPIAQRVAIPRRLRIELRQAEFVPDHFGALHEFACRQ